MNLFAHLATRPYTRPQDVGGTNPLFLNLDASNCIVDSWGRATQLTDSSGNGHHALVDLPTNSFMPALVLPEGFQGQPCLRLSPNLADDNNSYILPGLVQAQPFTLCVVGQIEGNQNHDNGTGIHTDYLFDGMQAGNRTGFTLNANGPSPEENGVFIGNSSLVFTHPLVNHLNQPQVWWFEFNGANSAVYLNNTLLNSGNLGSTSLQGLRLFSRYHIGELWRGLWRATRGYQGILSPATREAITAYERRFNHF